MLKNRSFIFSSTFFDDVLLNFFKICVFKKAVEIFIFNYTSFTFFIIVLVFTFNFINSFSKSITKT